MALAVGPETADAAAIRTARVAPARLRMASNPVLRARVRAAVQAVQAARQWDAYYERALQQQTRRVQVPPALRGTGAVAVAAVEPESAFLAYLRWRRNLNPARFDRYHPNLATILEDPPVVVPPITPGNVPNPNPNPRPNPNPQVPQVPEPSSILVLGGLFAGAALWRRRHQQRTAV